jgi:glycosyltransferase involved in cell wall biosynthesis
MNILYTNFHREDGGGHTTYILTLLKNSKRNTFVACPPTSMLYRILCDQGYDRLIPMDFPGKPKHAREIVKNALLLKRAIVEHKIDIVHTNGSPDNRMAFYVSLLTRKKFKVVFTKHNTIALNNAFSLLRLNRFNDAVIFVGDFLDYLGLKADNPRYHIIPNGIDTEHWQRTSPVSTSRQISLISTAGASRHKGWQHMMEAVAGLTPPEKARLSVTMLARHEIEMEKELAEAPGICNFLFPGFLSDVRPWLEKADIGFVLSYKEASSFAVREMLSMSLPLITSDFMTLAKDIGASCGWVTRMKDPDSIREVLRSILAMSPEDLSAMKEAARRRALEEFSLHTMIRRTDDLYLGLMEEKNRE